MPVEVGIGPAIKKREKDFPFIVVIPRAEGVRLGSRIPRTRKRALAMLDEVMKEYKVDPKRQYLTGLSMGGMGTWSIAMAHPDRFAAIVPICGRGDTEDGREDQGPAVLVLPRRRGRRRQCLGLARHDRGDQEGRRDAEVHGVPEGRAQLVGQGLRAPTNCTRGCWSRRRSDPGRAAGVSPLSQMSPLDRDEWARAHSRQLSLNPGEPLMSNPVNRRAFLAGSRCRRRRDVAPAASYARIQNANDKLRVGFLGVGGRCQQHIDVILKMQKEGKAVQPVAVCDVWDGQVGTGPDKGRGLYPSAERCGLNKDDKKHVTKDYRKILEQKDVDVVCIATPGPLARPDGHRRHERRQGRLLEKPMTKTIAEAIAVVDTAQKTNKVMTVGVQSMADPTWRAAHEYIAAGNIGHVLQGQTSYFRN